MADPKLKTFEFDKVEIGEDLGAYEYVLTQEMLEAKKLKRAPRKRAANKANRASKRAPRSRAHPR